MIVNNTRKRAFYSNFLFYRTKLCKNLSYRHNVNYFHLLSSTNPSIFQIFYLIHKRDKLNYFHKKPINENNIF